jgi:hypothetical protein
MAKNLLGMATEADSETTRLAATNSALDRAGVSGKTTVDVEVGVKPYEEVFAGIANITREQHRALQQGLPIPPRPAPELDDQAELPRAHQEPEPAASPEPKDDNIIDAEVVPLMTMDQANAALAGLPRPRYVTSRRTRRRGR